MIKLKKSGLVAVMLVLCLVFELPGQALATSYKGKYTDLTPLFKKPKQRDLLLSAGINMASYFLPAAFAPASKRLVALGNSAGSFAVGAFTSSLAQLGTNLAATKWGFNADTAQLVGYGISGLTSGIFSALANPEAYTFGKIDIWEDSKNAFWNKQNSDLSKVLRGAVGGMLEGAALGASNLLVYDFMLKDTGFYKDNPYFGNMAVGLIGTGIGHIGYNLVMGDVLGMNTYGVCRSERKDRFASTKLAFSDPAFLRSMISQGVAGSLEYFAQKGSFGNDLQKSFHSNRLLGFSQALGGMAGAGFTNGNIWSGFGQGFLAGGFSASLNALGGRYNGKGVNRWGLTATQMAAVNWAGSYIARGLWNMGDWKQAALDLSYDYTSFGRTSPIFTKGAGGYTSMLYLEKLAQFGGYANFRANTDYLMRLYDNADNYTTISWKEFVKEGGISNVIGSWDNALVRYTTSVLHNAAVDNFSAVTAGIISASGNGVKSWVTKVKKEQILPKDYKAMLEDMYPEGSEERADYIEENGLKRPKATNTVAWLSLGTMALNSDQADAVLLEEGKVPYPLRPWGTTKYGPTFFGWVTGGDKEVKSIEPAVTKNPVIALPLAAKKPADSPKPKIPPSQTPSKLNLSLAAAAPVPGEEKEKQSLLWSKQESESKDVKGDDIKYLGYQVNEELKDNRGNRTIGKVVQDKAREMDDIVLNGKVIEEGDAFKGVSLFGKKGLVEQVKSYLDEKFQKEIDKTIRSVGTGKKGEGAGRGIGSRGIGKGKSEVKNWQPENPSFDNLFSGPVKDGAKNMSFGELEFAPGAKYPIVRSSDGTVFARRDNAKGVMEVAIYNEKTKELGDFYTLTKGGYTNKLSPDGKKVTKENIWRLTSNWGVNKASLSDDTVARLVGLGGGEKNKEWAAAVRAGQVNLYYGGRLGNPSRDEWYHFTRFNTSVSSSDTVNVLSGCNPGGSTSSSETTKLMQDNIRRAQMNSLQNK